MNTEARQPLDMPHQPDGIELVQVDHSGNWFREWLGEWASREEGRLVRSIIPTGFEAYARVFHPAQSQTADAGWERVRWSTVAAWNGKVVHPQMSFYRIANIEPGSHPTWGHAPFYGDLPKEECRVLVSALKGFTSTPERCYFGLWHGYGFLDHRRFKKAPKLRIPSGEEYLVFRGPLDSILSFYENIEGRWGQPPNIWWPEDWAWCVATDIESLDTYLGGSESCIGQVLAHPDLEILPIAANVRVDYLGDTVNA